MTAILCEKCGDYGWDMVDGVCSVCLDGHKQAQPEQKFEPVKCAYCGKPASQLYLVWVNGGRIEKNFCDNMCANYYQMGAEG